MREDKCTGSRVSRLREPEPASLPLKISRADKISVFQASGSLRHNGLTFLQILPNPPPTPRKLNLRFYFSPSKLFPVHSHSNAAYVYLHTLLGLPTRWFCSLHKKQTVFCLQVFIPHWSVFICPMSLHHHLADAGRFDKPFGELGDVTNNYSFPPSSELKEPLRPIKGTRPTDRLDVHFR